MGASLERDDSAAMTVGSTSPGFEVPAGPGWVVVVKAQVREDRRR